MTKQIKLVKCGSTIYIYDFDCKQIISELSFERSTQGNTLNLEKLLLTNFVNDSLLAVFCLRTSLNEYEHVQEKLNQFVKHLRSSSGHHDIKYLAVTEPPTGKNKDYAYIHLITNIDIQDILIAVDDDIIDEEEYFETFWGDELMIDVYSPRELVTTFTSAYEKALTSDTLEHFPRCFHRNLEHPIILWNEEAESFMDNHELSEYPFHQSFEIYDDKTGFVIINEYSLYD